MSKLGLGGAWGGEWGGVLGGGIMVPLWQQVGAGAGLAACAVAWEPVCIWRLVYDGASVAEQSDG